MLPTMAPLRTGRRLFAVANIATVLSVSLWAASAAAPAAVPNSSKQDAVSGARYLAGLIGSKGYLTSSDGSPDDPNTANAILAMHAAGFGGIAAHAAESYLQAHRDAFVTRNGQDDAGRLATAILAAHAEGTNPRQYGGTDAHADLVGRLLATQRTTGKDAGLFGSTDPSFDGAFRQGLALLALSSVGQRNAPALAWLQAQQCAGGGWESYRADASVACGKTDPAAFSGPDTNSTALAVEAFVAAGVAPAHDPLPFLHGQQSSGGGFASFGGPTIAADPDSTGLVLQALVALGQNPAGASWTRPGGTPFTALAGFQLSSGAAAGAYFFDTKSRKPSVLATVQAVPGAAGAPLPIGPGQLAPGGAVTGPTSAAPSTSAASGGATPTGAAPTATTPAATTPAALTPRGTAAPQLPNTGSRDVLPLTVTGAGLLLAGAAAVAGSRRRTAGGSHRS